METADIVKPASYYALAIRCPGCGAPPGKPCRSKAAKRLTHPHRSRLPDVWPQKVVDLFVAMHRRNHAELLAHVDRMVGRAVAGGE